MENNVNQAILDKITKVCVCKSISRAKIKEAIKAGATTVEAVQKATGAGLGQCNGSRCTYIIQELINNNAKINKDNL